MSDHQHKWEYVPGGEYCEEGCGYDPEFRCKVTVSVTHGQNGNKLKRKRYENCFKSLSMSEVEAILNGEKL